MGVKIVLFNPFVVRANPSPFSSYREDKLKAYTMTREPMDKTVMGLTGIRTRNLDLECMRQPMPSTTALSRAQLCNAFQLYSIFHMGVVS